MLRVGFFHPHIGDCAAGFVRGNDVGAHAGAYVHESRRSRSYCQVWDTQRSCARRSAFYLISFCFSLQLDCFFI